MLRVLPYGTHENTVDGVVMKLVDINTVRTQLERIKELAGQCEIERVPLDGVLEQIPIAVTFLDAPSGRLLLANKQSEQTFCWPFFPAKDMEEYNNAYKIFNGPSKPYKLEERPVARPLRTGEAVVGEEVRIEVDGKYRTAQLALTIAHLHFGARKVIFGIVQKDDFIAMEISDDGHGVSPLSKEDKDNGQRVPLGVGVASMRDRIEQLGGKLKFFPARRVPSSGALSLSSSVPQQKKMHKIQVKSIPNLRKRAIAKMELWSSFKSIPLTNWYALRWDVVPGADQARFAVAP